MTNFPFLASELKISKKIIFFNSFPPLKSFEYFRCWEFSSLCNHLKIVNRESQTPREKKFRAQFMKHWELRKHLTGAFSIPHFSFRRNFVRWSNVFSVSWNLSNRSVVRALHLQLYFFLSRQWFSVGVGYCCCAILLERPKMSRCILILAAMVCVFQLVRSEGWVHEPGTASRLVLNRVWKTWCKIKSAKRWWCWSP